MYQSIMYKYQQKLQQCKHTHFFYYGINCSKKYKFNLLFIFHSDKNMKIFTFTNDLIKNMSL